MGDKSDVKVLATKAGVSVSRLDLFYFVCLVLQMQRHNDCIGIMIASRNVIEEGVEGVRKE